ncbi:nuclear transport factor 2 family protein [Hymenobacter chitinivorans]|uniref:Uncharacterized protein DUF4440 n=1 Tax=Hymenobacter chitinivorans DSM 11115 TaxID=1121954 RepID=A0A2M9BSP2_9BACT|nr:nuclear transport factor 2 family protein [Hymenobacter chitinivorans]PJJ60957.1 uncharacterized protein DUF4440 [Hymenobacter chitinivorans DSM 11115]
MKKLFYLLWLLPLAACNDQAPATPTTTTEFSSPEEARTFFYALDDQHNRAMAGHDSAFFAGHFAPGYFNCTPNNELNDKAAEIQTLIHGPWLTVQRMAPQFDVFAFAGNLASLTLTKRIKIRTPAGEQFIYVRRTTVFEHQGAGWRAISGQGTYVQTRYVGQ